MRYKVTKNASILGVITNLFLLVIKAIIGLLSSSMSMISDAFNSFGDIFSSIMTFIGNKIASNPSDEDHNLGHGKAEYIYSMLISIFMIITALFMFKNSLFSIIFGNKVSYSIYLLVVCIITIIIKFCLYIYTNKLSKKYNNLLIKANSNDHRNDCFVTFGTLISCILSKYNIYIVDSLVACFISIWILITSIKIFKESYDVLMDKAIDNETKKKVFKIINKYDKIKKVIHFNSTPVGFQYQISFTIYVDGNMSTFDSHEIADSLEKEIASKCDEIYLTVIHVNPM